MFIHFKVGGKPVEFYRSWFTGRTELRLRDQVVTLQSALNPLTHVSLELTTVWRHGLGDHEIVIEKVRPLLFAGIRPHSYRVLVDDEVVAEERGF